VGPFAQAAVAGVRMVGTSLSFLACQERWSPFRPASEARAHVPSPTLGKVARTRGRRASSSISKWLDRASSVTFNRARCELWHAG
jgi:hypothetical protein